MARAACVIFFSLLFGANSPVRAENWPGWRGPRGDGTSLDENVPTHWNATTGENIAWKCEIPGVGVSSPIIWEDRVFLLSCIKESHQRILVCVDRPSGSVAWQQTVITCPLESIHPQNSHASSTPATDGETIFVSFLEVDGRLIPAPNVGTPRDITPGQMCAAAYDFEGNQKWIVRPGEFISAHGFSSSPVLFENLVIVNGDHDGESYVVALDKQTGDVVWKVPRRHKIRSYCTPLIREIDGRTQMVMSGSKHVSSMDPRTGSEYWFIEGPTEQFVASMVYDGRNFYLNAGYPTDHVMAVRPDGSGDVTATHVAWETDKVKSYVPSPVLVGDRLFVADDRGTGNCYDTATGERIWQDRIGRGFHGSLVTAGGLVYFTDDDGVTKVVEPAEEMKVVGEGELGEFVSSSPAIADSRLYLRGDKHLFCIAEGEQELNAAK